MYTTQVTIFSDAGLPVRTCVVVVFLEGLPLPITFNFIEIFNFALREVPANVNELFSLSKKNIADTNYFVFHQANKLINESVRKKLKITDTTKVPYSISHFGNTSSASIPLTMITELSQQLSESTQTLCLCGFGVGYSWGSAIIDFDKIVCLPLIEI